MSSCGSLQPIASSARYVDNGHDGPGLGAACISLVPSLIFSTGEVLG
jgi:hypothetical protein